MATHGWKSRLVAGGLVVVGLSVSGCGGGGGTKTVEVAEPASQSAPEPAQAAASMPSAVPTPSAAPAESTVAPTPKRDPKLHQSFDQATAPEVPDGQQLPVDQTVAGKPTGLLHDAVVKEWDSVLFTTEDGKPLEYTATLHTDAGPIVIALRHDLAPNHVRNFITLAKVGYYDGLRVDRLVRGEGAGGTKVEVLEAGCPAGTGEPGIGHIGYWLNPEFSDKLPHEEGVVGACREDADASAGCRFYVCLSKVPAMDGNFSVFGKVVSGLDVARTMIEQPAETQEDGSFRPTKPVVIQKVTITRHEAN